MARELDARKPRDLLARLLDAPHLPEVVRSLEPQVLHRLVTVCGLEDCSEIVALATPEQLMGVLDIDVWRNDTPGQDDRLDIARFGLWLEVLVDAGVEIAAEKLVGLDIDFVTAALSRQLTILNHVPTERDRDNGPWCTIEGYTIVAKHSDSWDAIQAVLVQLAAAHRDFFALLMNRCWRIAMAHIDDNGILYHVLGLREQVMSEVAAEREERREKQGFVTPAQAVAFLEGSRRVRLDQDVAPRRDPITSSYFRDLARHIRPSSGQSAIASSGPAPAVATAGFVETLREAGIIGEGPRPLLSGGTAGEAGPLSRIRTHLQLVAEQNPTVSATRHEELAYLANALVAGCPFDSDRFSGVQASDAAVAVCNLGLENWPRRWRPGADSLSADFLVSHDLVTVFQVGWAVLHESVGINVSRRLLTTLARLRCDDREVQADVEELCGWLRQYISAGTPWRVRDRLEVIAILDTPAWLTLAGLLDQCPVVPRRLEPPKIPKRMLRVAADYEFISENRQIAWVESFMEHLPEALESGKSMWNAQC
ncbi:MAG TPA: DUF6178 family protein [Vicinamibacterales bacterium]